MAGGAASASSWRISEKRNGNNEGVRNGENEKNGGSGVISVESSSIESGVAAASENTAAKKIEKKAAKYQAWRKSIWHAAHGGGGESEEK